jgi:hypothetical protein
MSINRDTKIMLFTGAMGTVYMGYLLLKRKIMADHCDKYNECCTRIEEAGFKAGKPVEKIDGLIHI